MIWPYIILSYLSLFVLGLSDNIRGPLFAEILKTFSLSDSQGALFFAFSSSAGFVGNLLGAKLLKRRDKLRVLEAGVLLCALGLIGLSLSPKFSFFLLASLIFGFSMGIMGVSQNTLAAEGSSEERRGQILSGLHAMYGLSSLLAPLFVSYIWGLTQTWRWVFAIASLIPILIFFYSLARSRKGVRAKDLFLKTDLNLSESEAEEVVPFKIKIWVALTLGFYVLTEIMVSSRLALYVEREKGVSLQVSSYYVSAFFVFLLIGRLLGAVTKIKMSIYFQLLFCLVASFVVLSIGILVHPFALALSGLFMAPFYPLAIAYMAKKFPKNLGSVISISMAAQSALIVVMHIVVGRLSDQWGLQKALLIGPLALIVSMVLLCTFEFYTKSET